MKTCENCGQQNPEGDLFCRKCGRQFLLEPEPQKRPSDDFEISPPEPYSWKTGEFKQKSKRGARTTSRFDNAYPASDPLRTGGQMVRHDHSPLYAGYRCPYCGTTALPIVTRRVSTAGWVVFTVLLVTTLFLFWIGLLLQEEVRVCSVCNRKLG